MRGSPTRQSIVEHVDPEGGLSLADVEDPSDPAVFERLADIMEDVLDEVDRYLQDGTGPYSKVWPFAASGASFVYRTKSLGGQHSAPASHLWCAV
jgi:hypothetical protein